MIQEIYQKNLLRLAADAIGEGIMENADAEVTLDNPTCGDRITVQIKIRNNMIEAIKHTNRSCMLCQASASVIGQNAAGHSLDEIISVRDGMDTMLRENITSMPFKWENLTSFTPVADHKSRHACVLLPFDALISAFQKTGATS